MPFHDPRNRLEGMKIGTEWLSKSESIGLTLARIKNIPKEIHSHAFRILNRMVILIYSPL